MATQAKPEPVQAMFGVKVQGEIYQAFCLEFEAIAKANECTRHGRTARVIPVRIVPEVG